MAVQPDTTTGLLTTTAGSINFTTSGTNLITREHLPGDRFLVKGLELQIATITDENVGTLTEVCPPEAAVSGYPVRLRFQPDGARVAAQTRNLIDLIGNGTLQSLAELNGNADELIAFQGPFTLTTVSRSSLIEGAAYDAQVNTLADRAAYDNRPANYSVLVSDIGDGRAAIYVKRSDTDGDWSSPAYVTGPAGPIASIEAGTTTTVTPTTPANVTVTPNGSGGYTLNFSIPQGFQGVPGADGEQGPQGSGLEIDAVGPFSDRSNYDNQPEGFTFFDTENGNLYFRVGSSGNWSDPVAFQGPPGNSGALITTTTGVGNGTVGPYTLNAAPINSESVWVSISGVQQYDYTISGTNITFGVQVPTGVPWQVKTSGPLPIGTAQFVDDGVITADSLTNDENELELIRDKIGSGNGIPSGGTKGQKLTKTSSTDYEVSWVSDRGISITDYGAVMGGPSTAAADTLAFQEACDNNKKVFIPPEGQLWITDTIQAQPGTFISGEIGWELSRIYRANFFAGPSIRFGNETVGSGQFKIENIFLDNPHFDFDASTSTILGTNRLTADQAHIAVFQGTGGIIRDCWIQNGVYNIDVLGHTNLLIDHVQFSGVWDSDNVDRQECKANVRLGRTNALPYTTATKIINCYQAGVSNVSRTINAGTGSFVARLDGGPRDGVLIEACESFEMNGGYVGANGRNAVRIRPAIANAVCTNIDIHNVFFDGARESSIHISNGANDVFSNIINIHHNRFNGQLITPSVLVVANEGYNLPSVAALSFNNNISNAHYKSACLIYGGRAIRISDNMLSSYNARRLFDNDEQGNCGVFAFDQARDVYVQNNIFGGTVNLVEASGTTNGAKYGANAGSGVTGAAIGNLTYVNVSGGANTFGTFAPQFYPT